MKEVRYSTGLRWVGTMKCPACYVVVRAWQSSGMSQCCPHFYCTRCSNVIHRAQDQARYQIEGASPELLAELAASLPECPCGGRFVPGANPKCPNCRTDFAHQAGALQRLSDPHMIVLHGACVFSDEREPYRVLIDEEPT